ncbi:DUF4184 family protein [Cryptosporangium sp. NPDC048952]|uniref:DUF4184 family protein n=1 Tax=Cryptosporangium sp. NPDC048952 TaxID=3363961 RepID=UPI003718B5D1
MPLTYVSHQVPALAAKLARPDWFDGTALALGSMSPDWPFALAGTRWEVNAHNTRGVLLLCVPASVVAAVAARRLAFAASYLPEFPGMPLRRLALLDSRRPSPVVTVLSALAGAWSHVAWDSFTHDGRWGARHVPWLAGRHHVGGRPVSGAVLAQHTSTVVGGVVGLVLLSRVLREVPDWVDTKPPGWSRQRPAAAATATAGAARATAGTVRAAPTTAELARAARAAVEPGEGVPPGQKRFWASVAAGTAAGAVWGSRGGWDGRFNLAVLVIRTSFGTAAGAVAGALVARRKLRGATSV